MYPVAVPLNTHASIVQVYICTLCTGVLLYFLDGVLPLVRFFFANLFSPPKEGESRGMQLRITDRLLSNLLVCAACGLYQCVYAAAYSSPLPSSGAGTL